MNLHFEHRKDFGNLEFFNFLFNFIVKENELLFKTIIAEQLFLVKKQTMNKRKRFNNARTS